MALHKGIVQFSTSVLVCGPGTTCLDTQSRSASQFTACGFTLLHRAVEPEVRADVMAVSRTVPPSESASLYCRVSFCLLFERKPRGTFLRSHLSLACTSSDTPPPRFHSCCRTCSIFYAQQLQVCMFDFRATANKRRFAHFFCST